MKPIRFYKTGWDNTPEARAERMHRLVRFVGWLRGQRVPVPLCWMSHEWLVKVMWLQLIELSRVMDQIELGWWWDDMVELTASERWREALTHMRRLPSEDEEQFMMGVGEHDYLERVEKATAQRAEDDRDPDWAEDDAYELTGYARFTDAPAGGRLGRGARRLTTGVYTRIFRG